MWDVKIQDDHLLYCSKHLLYWLEAFGRVIEYIDMQILVTMAKKDIEIQP